MAGELFLVRAGHKHRLALPRGRADSWERGNWDTVPRNVPEIFFGVVPSRKPGLLDVVG